jgi:hypothetical protein
MCSVYVNAQSPTIILMATIDVLLVPPPNPSGRFAEALRLFEQFRQESDLEAAQQSIDIYHALLAYSLTDMQGQNNGTGAHSVETVDSEHPLGSHTRYHVLIQLARTLAERYQYAGDSCDLESVARHGEEALAVCRAGNIVCPTVWVLYADILRSRFEVTTSSGELHMAEVLCREAMSLCTDFHPLSPTVCHTLSWILRRLYGQSRKEVLINEAECLQRVGLERLPEADSHDRHRHLLRLALILAEKRLNGGNQGNEDVVSIMSEAFQLCPPKHVDKWMLQSSITQQLLFEYYRSSELEVLNRAIELGRQALRMGHFPPNASKQAIVLARMADSLRLRHLRAGTNDKDLEESVELHRKALQMSFSGDLNHWIHVAALAEVLILQFRSDGDVSHLEEASQVYHHTMDMMSEENSRRPYIISGLADSLGLRFRDTGDITELNRAIDLDAEAVAALRPGQFNYWPFALQTAYHLCLRFEVLQDNADLKKAITLAEGLLKSLPDGDINLPKTVNILSKARLLHAIGERSFEDIDLAIAQLLSVKDALLRSTLGPEGLRTLSVCYLLKFRQSSVLDMALLAKDAINEALNVVGPDHYEWFQCLIDAAKLYMEHETPYYDMDCALTYLSDALQNTHRDARSKIHGAKSVLTKLEIENHDIFTTKSSISMKLLDIMRIAVLLLPRIAFFGIHPYSRLKSLQEGQSIAMIGASHALNLSSPEKALEIMEQGRAIFWTHSLRLRSSFDEIPKEPRDKLISLARQLERVTGASDNSMDQRYIEREIAQRRKESEQFNSLIEQVRCLPGLERFMLPDEYSTLKGAAEKGAVAVLVCSGLACHAIILEPSGSVASIPLGTTNKWLMESALVWRSTVIDARSEMRNGRKLVKSKKALDSRYKHVNQILRLLWINVVLPVIEALRLEVCLIIFRLHIGTQLCDIQPAQGRDRPRIWWCPTGYFAHLPIHASGADGKWCSDYVVSSYTPTLSSLIGTRKGYIPVKKQDIRALIAAVPQSFLAEWSELVSTQEEVSAVKAALPDGTLISIRGTNETVNGDTSGVTAGALLEKLPEATILHLACHGRQNPDNALESGFVMSDEMLTIERLMQVPLPRAFMAFLSACETAKGDQASNSARLVKSNVG